MMCSTVFLIIFIFLSLSYGEGKKRSSLTLPYRGVEICNESPHPASIKMVAKYHNQDVLVDVEKIAAETCGIVEVLPGVDYSAFAQPPPSSMSSKDTNNRGSNSPQIQLFPLMVSTNNIIFYVNYLLWIFFVILISWIASHWRQCGPLQLLFVLHFHHYYCLTYCHNYCYNDIHYK